jgi:hypothetical protein
MLAKGGYSYPCCSDIEWSKNDLHAKSDCQKYDSLITLYGKFLFFVKKLAKPAQYRHNFATNRALFPQSQRPETS